MFITRIIYNILRHPIHWQETHLRKKAQRKKKAIYSSLEKEKMKKLAALFKSNQIIK